MRFFAGVGQLVTFAITIWALLFALAFSPVQLLLFRRAFYNSNGHYLGGRLSEAIFSAKPTCIIIGTSVARAALDSAVLNELEPRYRFINAATNAGSIFRLEWAVRELEAHNIRPACLVIGLQSHLLRDRGQGYSASGFLDTASLSTQYAMIRTELSEDRAYTYSVAAQRLVWPPLRESTQISRLIRSGLFAIQQRWPLRQVRDRASFEIMPGELTPLLEQNPKLVERWSEQELASFRNRLAADEFGGLDPRLYAHPRHLSSLRYILEHGARQSPVVIALILPETAFVREQLTPPGDAAMHQVLREAASDRIHVVDRRERFPDADFADLYHMLPGPRVEFSREIGAEISKLLAGAHHGS